MTYGPEKARRRYKAKREEYQRAKEAIDRLGLAGVVEEHVEEILHSPNLKIFRAQPRTGKAHLYAELSDGTKHPLCGESVDEDLPAASIRTTRRGDCERCNRAADEILKRRSVF